MLSSRILTILWGETHWSALWNETSPKDWRHSSSWALLGRQAKPRSTIWWRSGWCARNIRACGFTWMEPTVGTLSLCQRWENWKPEWNSSTPSKWIPTNCWWLHSTVRACMWRTSWCLQLPSPSIRFISSINTRTQLWICVTLEHL